jgi:putative flippase GtrA
LAASAGFVVGLLINYAFHAKITFNRVGAGGALWRYLCVVAINYALTLAMVALAQHWFDYPLLGKLASLPLVAVNGYWLSKQWVFK